MIQTINQDITTVGAGSTILQICNCKGGYGAGLSGIISRKWQKVEDMYRLNHQHVGLGLGTIMPVQVDKAQNIWVINLLAMPDYARKGVAPRCYLDYRALEQALKATHELVTDGKFHSSYIRDPMPALCMHTRICIPMRMGCALAGGDWTTVYKLCVEELNDFDVYQWDVWNNRSLAQLDSTG